jgi:hypothetical protein
MKDVFEKLSVRSTDYIATVDVEDSTILSNLHSSCKGMVCVGKVSNKNFEGLGTVKLVKGVKQLDPSIFNKILAVYNDELNIKGLVTATENFGLVLICRVPEEKRELFTGLLAQKAGIFDVWNLDSDKKGAIDILFKVRKY